MNGDLLEYSSGQGRTFTTSDRTNSNVNLSSASYLGGASSNMGCLYIAPVTANKGLSFTNMNVYMKHLGSVNPAL
jgi:hypothetical protein